MVGVIRAGRASPCGTDRLWETAYGPVKPPVARKRGAGHARMSR